MAMMMAKLLMAMRMAMHAPVDGKMSENPSR
jgi:hypothetical protein